jgi:nucleotide-binding universal stress UspA family protein
MTMMPQMKKILYATDLSANSGYVLGHAIDMAKKYGAKITVLHVLEQSSASISALAEVYLSLEQIREVTENKFAYARETLQERLQKFCQKELADETGAMQIFDVIKVVEGFPADQILRKADEFKCDAIVMGTHGKGSLMHSYFGSTAKRVIRRSHLPVFVVPLPKGESDNSHDED